VLGTVADDAVLAEAEIAIRHRPARTGKAVDVDTGLGGAEQRVAVGETRRRVPERGGPAIGVEKAVGRGSVLGDDRGRETGRFLVCDAHRLLEPGDDANGDRGDAAGLRCPLAARWQLVLDCDPQLARDARDVCSERCRVGEREVEPITDPEAIEARADERVELLGIAGRVRARRAPLRCAQALRSTVRSREG
jgi:hypothetical protein